MCIETVPSTLNLSKTPRLLITQSCAMSVDETITLHPCLHVKESKTFDLSTILSTPMEAT